LEFTHAVGPHAGRYVVEPGLLRSTSPTSGGSPDPALDTRNQAVAGVSKGVGDSDVLVVGIAGAPAGRVRLLRKARQVKPEAAPSEVPLSIVTFIKGTQPLQERREAARRLDELRFSEEHQKRWVDDALQVLNLAIRAYRAGAPDPYALEVTRRDAREVRIGYGTTEQVQNGHWEEAVELPPPAQRRTKRIERLRPAEAVASVLSGHATVLGAEDLFARALIDLDNDRPRAAAFQVGAAISLLGAEARSIGDHGGPDLGPLTQHAARARELERIAAERELDRAEIEALEAIIDGVESALDAWRYGQLP
jgi:hypothetical protein